MLNKAFINLKKIKKTIFVVGNGSKDPPSIWFAKPAIVLVFEIITSTHLSYANL